MKLQQMHETPVNCIKSRISFDNPRNTPCIQDMLHHITTTTVVNEHLSINHTHGTLETYDPLETRG